MMRQMITEQIKALASPEMQALRNQMQAFFADNVFDEGEAAIIERMATQAQRTIDRYVGQGINGRLLRDAEAAGGAKPEASRGAFQAMSQDTANELGGRFTALQQGVLGISGVLDDLRTLGALQTAHLEDIAKSNRELYRIASRLDEVERNTRALR